MGIRTIKNEESKRRKKGKVNQRIRAKKKNQKKKNQKKKKAKKRVKMKMKWIWSLKQTQKKNLKRRLKKNRPKKKRSPRRSLKKLKQGDVNVALNQLRQKGISAESFRKSVVAAVKKIYKAAGPQRKNFAQKDTPTIKMISNEVVKILKGDFSNLVNESRKPFFMVHPVTYAVIKLLGESKQSIQISIRRNKK